jgi:hypothetical protein
VYFYWDGPRVAICVDLDDTAAGPL